MPFKAAHDAEYIDHQSQYTKNTVPLTAPLPFEKSKAHPGRTRWPI
jgi:hypothetical protein